MLRSKRYSRTASSTEPVAIGDVRWQLRIDHENDDSDLTDMISEARLDCETKLGDRSLINATCIDRFDGFDDDELELHWGPVSAISSIAYVDTSGDTQTLSTDIYELGQRYGIGIVRLKHNQTWPSTRGHEDVVTVTYTAGYGTAASDMPKGLRRWIKARVAWLWGNRDGEEYPWNLDSLLTPYATNRVIG